MVQDIISRLPFPICRQKLPDKVERYSACIGATTGHKFGLTKKNKKTSTLIFSWVWLKTGCCNLMLRGVRRIIKEKKCLVSLMDTPAARGHHLQPSCSISVETRSYFLANWRCEEHPLPREHPFILPDRHLQERRWVFPLQPIS